MSKNYKVTKSIGLAISLVALFVLNTNQSFGQESRGSIESPKTICSGDTVEFNYSDDGAKRGESYNWDFGKNATIIGSKYSKTVKVVFDQPGQYEAKMVKSDDKGGSEQTAKSLEVGDCCGFEAVISSSVDTVCYGDYVSFTAQDEGDEFYYTWNFGANGSSASNSGVGPHYVFFTGTGLQTVTLAVGKICDCDNCDEQTDQYQVFVKPRPNANVSVSNTAGCNYVNTSYTATTSSISGATYSWNAGNGSITGTGNSVNVSWPTDGSKQMCVTVNQDGCVATDCETVSVIDATCPDADFSIPTEVCQGYNMNFSASDEGYGVNYSWSFTGASSSNKSGRNVTNKFTTAGTQTITLTVSKCGCSNDILQKTITVKPTPNANLSGPSCGSTNSNLVYTAAAFSGATFDWTLSGGGTGTSSTNSITASWPSEGNKTVCLTATYDGCEDTDCNGVEIVSPACPTAIFTLPDTICQNGSFVLNATDQGFGTDYTWAFGSGISASTNSGDGPIYLYFSGNGDQDVTLTVSKCNCSDDDLTKTVYVIPEPSATITGNAFVYVDSVTTFTTPPVAGATYTWTIDGSYQVNNSNTLTTTFNTIGYKEVCVTVTSNNAYSCEASDCFTTGVIEYDCPEAIIDAPTTICAGGIATISAEDQGCGVDYYWLIGGVNYSGMIQQVTFNSPGTYPIQLIITTCGCNDCESDTSTVNITVTPTPTADVSGPAVGEINTPYTFSTPSNTNVTYTWDTDGGIGSSSTNVIDIEWSTIGTKTVCVTVSSGACSVQDCHDIEIEDPGTNDTCAFDAEFDFKQLGYMEDIDSSSISDGGNSVVEFYLFQPNANTIDFKTDDFFLRNNTLDTTAYWSIQPTTDDSVRFIFNQTIESLEFDIYDLDKLQDGDFKAVECVKVTPYIGGNPITLSSSDYTLGTLVTTTTNNVFCNQSATVPSNSNAGDVSFHFQSDVDSVHVVFLTESSGTPTIPKHEIGISDLGHCSLVPVPVTWISVNAVQKGKDVEVSWSTAQEINNREFVVQRSVNGGDFMDIKTVPGAGNSNNIEKYSIVDEDGISGSVHYRIMQVDFNGDFDYSRVVSLRLLSAGQVGVRPNPAKTNLSLNSTEIIPVGTIINLSDTYGKIHQSINVQKNTHIVNIDVQQMSTGVYFVSFVRNGIIITEKIVIEN